jgi:hypothetical protein
MECPARTRIAAAPGHGRRRSSALLTVSRPLFRKHGESCMSGARRLARAAAFSSTALARHRRRRPERGSLRHPIATTCAPSRATASDRDHASVNREPPLCGKRASVSVASHDRDTGVRLSSRRPSRLFPGDRQFRHFARIHRNLLQAIDKPSAGGARR